MRELNAYKDVMVQQQQTHTMMTNILMMISMIASLIAIQVFPPLIIFIFLLGSYITTDYHCIACTDATPNFT